MLLQYDVTKNEVVHKEANYGNRFVDGPVLIVTSSN